MPARRVGSLPRLKGFPKQPRLPYELGVPGETEDDVFENKFQVLRQSYAAITRPEARVFLWLTDRFGPNSIGQDWAPFVTFAYDYREDGIEVDFYIYDANMVWQVQGERFHFGDPTIEGEDLIEKEVLETSGLTVVDLLESMIDQDVNRVCEAALAGEQLYDESNLSSGFTPFLGNASLERAQKVTR